MNRAEKRRQQKLAKKAGRGHFDVQQALHMATQHHAQGQLAQAEKAYKGILKKAPQQCDALHLLGVIAHQKGDDNGAVDLIRKALAINPGFAEAHNNLGDALQSLGNYDEAVSAYERALEIRPDFPEAHNNLGTVFHDLGKFEEAIASIKKATGVDPSYIEAFCNLGNVYRDCGRLDDAIHNYQKAISIHPDFAEAHFNLSLIHKQQGKFSEAGECLRKAVKLQPNSSKFLNDFAAVQAELGELEDAIALYGRALEINPNFAEAHNNMANVFKELGEFDKAEANYNKAIAIDPDYAEPYRHKAHMKKYTDYGEDIQELETAYAKPGISNTSKMHLAFALGKVFEDIGQYEKAFDFYSEGNALNRQSFNFSSDDHGNFFKAIKDTFDGPLFDRRDITGCKDETPVFILGMPRSGTTLVEQILASHPEVYGAGELETLGLMISSYGAKKGEPNYPDCVEHFSAADFKQFGEEYVETLKKISPKSRFIINKLPDNYLYLGLIKLALPNAKIIHCTRSPEDTCLSIFRMFFPAAGHYYAYDQVELGRHYNFYHDLMAHWEAATPNFIHEACYEKMVGETEAQTRLLLDFCDLEWDDACLEFHKSKRPVKTASSEQVRKPVYKTSIQGWKKYEKQLAPMLGELNL